jgi:hypothetical protein
MNDLGLVDMMIVLDQGLLGAEVIAEVKGRTAMMVAGMRGVKGGGTVNTSVSVAIMMWYVTYSLLYCYLLPGLICGESPGFNKNSVSCRPHLQPLL